MRKARVRAAACVTRARSRLFSTAARKSRARSSLDQQNLLTMIDNERFYSSIVQIKVGEQTQEAIVKDIQMHPAKNLVVHVDLLRVVPNEKIRIRLPIHFKGESISPGVKTQGGVVSHRLSDVEVLALPQNLPEYLELDLSQMNLNETKFLADVPVPEGVEIVGLAGGKNPPVVSVHSPRAEEPEAADRSRCRHDRGRCCARPLVPRLLRTRRRTTRLPPLLRRRKVARSNAGRFALSVVSLRRCEHAGGLRIAALGIHFAVSHGWSSPQAHRRAR